MIANKIGPIVDFLTLLFQIVNRELISIALCDACLNYPAYIKTLICASRGDFTHTV